MAKATHVVTHKRLYMAVKGKLEHFPVGTPLTLTAKQERLQGGRVAPLGDKETVDLTAAGTVDLTALKARAAELNIKDAHKFGEKRLNEEIKKAETAIEAGNAVTGQKA